LRNLVLAYLDPGAGSILLQLLLAGVAGAGILARTLWGRFRRKRTGQSSHLPDQDRNR